MKLSFLPREEKFFTLFHESAANLKETAVKLLDLMENYENVPEKVAEIKRLEEVGGYSYSHDNDQPPQDLRHAHR